MEKITFTSTRESDSGILIRYVLVNETLSLDEFTNSKVYSPLPFFSLPCMVDIYTALSDFIGVPSTDLFILSISRV